MDSKIKSPGIVKLIRVLNGMLSFSVAILTNHPEFSSLKLRIISHFPRVGSSDAAEVGLLCGVSQARSSVLAGLRCPLKLLTRLRWLFRVPFLAAVEFVVLSSRPTVGRVPAIPGLWLGQ